MKTTIHNETRLRGEKAEDEQPHTRVSLLVLALLAPLSGIAVGLVGASFRFALVKADVLRGVWISWAYGWGIAGFALVVAGVATAAGIAAWIVRRFAPSAPGSGIPQVEAVLSEQMEPAPPRLIIVKFVGGVLAIGAGLALGREGPSVHMGANIAHLTGKLFRRSWGDCRILLAAGAGAGLSTAFNAPISGAIFVLEELLKRFEVRTAMAALAACATAIWVERWMLGDAPDFRVSELIHPKFVQEPFFLLLGLAAGLAGIIHNKILIGGLETADRFAELRVELRAATVGAAVGVLAWFAPTLVGGGDPLTQQSLDGVGTLAMIPAIYVIRQALLSVSYAAGTPGGLFAPLLVLGAALGLWFGKLCAFALPGIGAQPEGFAVVGMAALFTGIVRAPLTGIILVTEMTDNVTMLLPMIVACFAAMLPPILVSNAPIYDSLAARLPTSGVAPACAASARSRGNA